MNWIKRHKFGTALMILIMAGVIGDVTGIFDGWVLYEVAGALFLIWMVAKALSHRKVKRGV